MLYFICVDIRSTSDILFIYMVFFKLYTITSTMTFVISLILDTILTTSTVLMINWIMFGRVTYFKFCWKEHRSRFLGGCVSCFFPQFFPINNSLKLCKTAHLENFRLRIIHFWIVGIDFKCAHDRILRSMTFLINWWFIIQKLELSYLIENQLGLPQNVFSIRGERV